MIVPCYGGPFDGEHREILDSTHRNSTVQFARQLNHKQPNASAFVVYKLNNDRKKLEFEGYSKTKFKDLK